MHCVLPWGRENVNILPRTASEVSLFIDACVAQLFSETMFPRLATGAAKHFFLFPANLATPGNRTTRSNVSATLFPSLARP